MPHNASDTALVDRIRAGDDPALEQLVRTLQPAMVHLARTFVASEAVAEEVVQDTWIAVIRGIDRFEGRSSLKTWVFRILVNTARTTGVREARAVPAGDVDLRFTPSPRFVGHADRGVWAHSPPRWSDVPEDVVLHHETFAFVTRTIAQLSETQGRVIQMRDMEGSTSSEVCDQLGISPVNQRVLLHRARSTVRADLAHCLA